MPDQPVILRVTGSEDGVLLNRGYSYYSQVWLHGAHALVFCGHEDGYPRFFRVDLNSGEIERLGHLVPYTGTAEGWYFDSQGRIYLTDGPRLRRYDLASGLDEIIFTVEPADRVRLWQAHSSDDGGVHSATVQGIVADGPYPNLGTVVAVKGVQQYFPAVGALDESQISGDGRWLLIKEDDDNRLIDLVTGNERTITNADGALGHSDNGPDFAVGEDDQIGACVYVPFAQPVVGRRVLFPTWNLGHVSVRGERCLRSSIDGLSLIALDGSGETPLAPHGMVGEGYDFQVFANLDHTARVAAFVSNHGSARMDLDLLILPAR